MTDLPPYAIEHLRRLCLDTHFPLFILADPRGLPIEWGGAFAHYGITEPSRAAPIGEQLDFLAGLLPLRGAALSVPLVQVGPSVYADIHLFAEAAGNLVILLDATPEAVRLAQIQQNANELALLRHSESRMHAEVQHSHDALQAVLDQLRLVTVIADPEGRIEFLSRTGLTYFGIDEKDARGRLWRDALPFHEQDRQRIEALMALGCEQRTRAVIRTRSVRGRRFWLEVDVQDDPQDRGKKILFLYDVTEVRDLREMLAEKSRFLGMIGGSEPMQQVFRLIRDVAGMDTTVLIEGATGTGKELAARAIHFSSHRKDASFIPVNCAGLTDSLINSQLFGHRKGSFTDAVSDQEGLFEAADGGTIFLDEIGDIPMNTQTRILRVLEEREIVRIGDTVPRKIDIRVLSATNKDLDEEVRNGRFRLDLLYRIRVVRIRLPPLHRRREDIPLLVEAFLERARASTGKEVQTVNTEAMRILMDQRWDGNVRELRNAIDHAVIRARGSVITPDDLPAEFLEIPSQTERRAPYGGPEEREKILAALRETGGDREAAARNLGVSRATLYRRMHACQINPRGLRHHARSAAGAPLEGKEPG